jgi:hypothetical protein
MPGLPALPPRTRVWVTDRDDHAPRRVSAGFAAQVLGQGGGLRGLRAGPMLLVQAHGSYRTAACAPFMTARRGLAV